MAKNKSNKREAATRGLISRKSFLQMLGSVAGATTIAGVVGHKPRKLTEYTPHTRENCPVPDIDPGNAYHAPLPDGTPSSNGHWCFYCGMGWASDGKRWFKTGCNTDTPMSVWYEVQYFDADQVFLRPRKQRQVLCTRHRLGEV